jgi:hypothetical protein
MRLSPLSQVRSAITGKNRFPVTIRQIQVYLRSFRVWQLQCMVSCRSRLNEVQLKAADETSRVNL